MSNLFSGLDAANATTKREQLIKPAFAYPGGKTKNFANILPHLPYRNSYIEPFGGSAAILLARDKSKVETYNDRHSGVVDFYKCVRDAELLKRLIDRIDMTSVAREEFRYAKDHWEAAADPVERAALWFTMTRLSFSSKGVCFGRTLKQPRVNPLSSKIPAFWPIHERFKNVQVENQDWSRILEDFDDYGAVFYLDPPYLSASKGIYKFEMSESDHVRMLNMVMDTKGFVAISGYPNELYDSYKWTDRVGYNIRCMMNGFATNDNGKDVTTTGTSDRTEVLWIKEAK